MKRLTFSLKKVSIRISPDIMSDEDTDGIAEGILNTWIYSFANSLDLDQTQHNVGPDLDQYCLPKAADSKFL